MPNVFRVDDGSRVSVFPGKATNLSIDDTNKQSTLGDKIQKLSEQTSDEKYKHTVGNCVTIRISDPYVSIIMVSSYQYYINDTCLTNLYIERILLCSRSKVEEHIVFTSVLHFFFFQTFILCACLLRNSWMDLNLTWHKNRPQYVDVHEGFEFTIMATISK